MLQVSPDGEVYAIVRDSLEIYSLTTLKLLHQIELSHLQGPKRIWLGQGKNAYRLVVASKTRGTIYCFTLSVVVSEDLNYPIRVVHFLERCLAVSGSSLRLYGTDKLSVPNPLLSPVELDDSYVVFWQNQGNFMLSSSDRQGFAVPLPRSACAAGPTAVAVCHSNALVIYSLQGELCRVSGLYGTVLRGQSYLVAIRFCGTIDLYSSTLQLCYTLRLRPAMTWRFRDNRYVKGGPIAQPRDVVSAELDGNGELLRVSCRSSVFIFDLRTPRLIATLVHQRPVNPKWINSTLAFVDNGMVCTWSTAGPETQPAPGAKYAALARGGIVAWNEQHEMIQKPFLLTLSNDTVNDTFFDKY